MNCRTPAAEGQGLAFLEEILGRPLIGDVDAVDTETVPHHIHLHAVEFEVAFDTTRHRCARSSGSSSRCRFRCWRD